MVSWKKIRVGAALVAATLTTAAVMAVAPVHHVARPAGPTSEPVKLTPPLMPAEAGKPLPKTVLA
ncbi:hypothetical protein [Caulobacter sp. UNC279MFTsu5.1]|uniref:hypothetical protein n=1 Tax=Caulobacter sp. UNC279MFTsu5.1 TaxID=1502775 RepID=UPI0008E34BAB|nr:hypothetical protein [Caulobacter sp. UNC279MFTsu5.1]SFJ51803.1 hypothetical protein SAMN02799626_01961 [Caulobacter sp. UNC279MFTsu5.1]